MRSFKRVFKVFLIIGIGSLLAYFSLYLIAYLSPKLSLEKGNNYYFYDSLDNLYSGNSKEWVNLEDISPYVINATIASEDKNFYDHIGFDYLRIIKAMYTNIVNGAYLQGASTITQQLSKNLFLDFDKKWSRKIEEAWLTILFETQYSKDDILEAYLNSINYGGIFGIETASEYYFNKKAKDLTLAEASMLTGIPKSPANYSPLENIEAAKKRQKVVLTSMVKNKYITESEMKDAYNTNLSYVGKLDQNNLSTLMYYQDAVIEELKSIKTIPSSFLKTGGLKIYTTLDMDTQKNLEENIEKYLVNNPDLQSASIVMKPDTGEIIALTGGRDYSVSQFNRATHASRQVGSTIKPLLYYAALENGFTSSTTFLSTKTTFTFAEDKTYTPQNYGNKYGDKEISLATALVYSDNIYAVKTHLFLGEETLVDITKRLGITSNLEPNPSLALGSGNITLFEMVSAYSIFANEGYKTKPHFIRKVEDIDGNVLYEYENVKENVLNKNITFILNEMLSNCSSYEFVDFSAPTCLNIASKMNHKYAVKTGTTDTDNWIFGYNKNVIMGAWVGHDKDEFNEYQDGNSIKMAWIDTMEAYLKDSTNDWYPIPKNVVGVLVDPITGKLANETTKKKKIFYYIKGTEPSANTNLESSIPTIKAE